MRHGYVIYALLDPDTKNVRYIGATHQPKSRRRAYLSCTGASAGTPLGRWLVQLASEGKRPKFKVLVSLSGPSAGVYAAHAIEKLFIRHCANQEDGHLILNLEHNPRRPKQRYWSRQPKKKRTSVS